MRSTHSVPTPATWLSPALRLGMLKRALVAAGGITPLVGRHRQEKLREAIATRLAQQHAPDESYRLQNQ